MRNDFNHIAHILDAVTRAYIEALYFTDTGDTANDQPSSDVDLSIEASFQCLSTCADFLAHCGAELLADYELTGRTWDAFGHDYWFTRNGHGVGFWDRGMGELGDALSEKAKDMGSVYVYQGDDGLLYVERG